MCERVPIRVSGPRAARVAACVCLWAAVLAFGPAPASHAAEPAAADAVHPFYSDLLEQGVFAYQQGDSQRASTDLRLAVFGLLETPPRLVRGLVYLALAQNANGEAEPAAATLQRLLAVERSFGVYAESEIPASVRGAFESLLAARVPESTLAGVPAFRAMADAKFLARLSGLRPAERRTALTGRIAETPDEPRWLLALGELDLAERQFGAAAAHAARVLALVGDAGTVQATAARCLRGRALAATGGCTGAVEDLEACPAARTDVDVAAALLGCRMSLAQWLEAQALLDSLPPSVAAARPLSRHRRQVARQVARLPPPVEPAAAAAGTVAQSDPEPPGDPEASPATGAPPRASDPPASDPPAVALPAEATAELARAKALLDAARRASDLEEPLRISREIADGHPDSVEAQHFVAEIAYRASRWQEAASYFRRGGEPAQPEMLFYMAVSLFEAGEQEAAKPLLERALPSLPRTPFVQGYAERILGALPG